MTTKEYNAKVDELSEKYEPVIENLREKGKASIALQAQFEQQANEMQQRFGEDLDKLSRVFRGEPMETNADEGEPMDEE